MSGGEKGLVPADLRQAALERCDDQIAWYGHHSKIAWVFFVTLQTAAIVLGGMTPVLILWSDVPKAVQALPAALAAIAAALVGTFRWRENKARFAYTREALKSERIKFLTETAEYSRLDEQQALNRFVRQVEGLCLAEVAEWRGDFLAAGKGET